MAANQATLKQTPDEIVAEMSASLSVFASEGEWDRVEEIIVRLRSAVMLVPEDRRVDAIMLASQSIDEVEMSAGTARREVTTKLAAIRRGETAKKAYQGANKS